MKKFLKKAGDAVAVFLPFLIFFFIWSAYLHGPAHHNKESIEQIKAESKEKNYSPEEFESGVIRFIVL